MQDGSVGRTIMVLAASLFTAGGVAAAVTGVRPNLNLTNVILASAQLPGWNIAEICASDSAGGQCRILESEARRTLSGGWAEVPQAFRDACLGSIKSPYDKSYRLLSQCLEAEVLKGLDKDVIKTATVGIPLVSPAQAGEAKTATGSAGQAILPTTSTADLFAAREAWGKGPAAKEVAAPLAAGAVSPLPADAVTAPKGFDGQPTVHPLQATPAPQLTQVPQDQIADALKKLLAEREGWLKAPVKTAEAAGGAHAILPTTSTADLFAAREAWGKGPAAKEVAAPLAAGAVSPLPADAAAAPKGFEGQPTVHALESTPAPQLTPVPQDQIADAMKKLLAEREGWLKAPAETAEAPAPAAASNGYAVLPTTSTADLFAAREAWGKGPAAKEVAAPLAAGAYSPLVPDEVKPAKGFEGQPTVHALESTPAPQLTPVPQDQIADAMKKLLAERESWGAEPSQGGVTGGSSGGHAVLPTSSTADLIAAREAWGKGAAANKVAAPLAAGAKSPLPSDKIKPAAGYSGEPTVHALQATPAPQPTPVPQAEIDDAMKKLLATREGWGKAPGKVSAAPAATRSAEAADCEAKLRKAAASGVILFESSSATIAAKSNATLDQLASVAKGCAKGRIRVEGHTDSTGRAAFNKTLSEQRATAVADYLVKAGVAADRVEAEGYGAEKPVASNSTSAGRAKNRRIEFTVVE